jgi:hypothetical protein
MIRVRSAGQSRTAAVFRGAGGADERGGEDGTVCEDPSTGTTGAAVSGDVAQADRNRHAAAITVAEILHMLVMNSGKDVGNILMERAILRATVRRQGPSRREG